MIYVLKKKGKKYVVEIKSYKGQTYLHPEHVEIFLKRAEEKVPDYEKILLIAFFICFLSASPLFATQKDTIFVADYGVTPDTYENQTERLELLLPIVSDSTLRYWCLKKGRYDLWTRGATYKKFFITNTSSESECPLKIKTIGMFFEDMEGLTIEGNGATLMFHGKVTMLAFEHCKKMTLQNIHIDFERPGGSELTLTQINEKGVVAKFHPDSRYVIKDGKITLYGEGWRTNIPHWHRIQSHYRTFLL